MAKDDSNAVLAVGVDDDIVSIQTTERYLGCKQKLRIAGTTDGGLNLMPLDRDHRQGRCFNPPWVTYREYRESATGNRDGERLPLGCRHPRLASRPYEHRASLHRHRPATGASRGCRRSSRPSVSAVPIRIPSSRMAVVGRRCGVSRLAFGGCTVPPLTGCCDGDAVCRPCRFRWLDCAQPMNTVQTGAPTV
jgi:hypothetical protein